jgi:hypothetical protein
MSFLKGSLLEEYFRRDKPGNATLCVDCGKLYFRFIAAVARMKNWLAPQRDLKTVVSGPS